MKLLNTLCKLAVALYPKSFRREYGDDIVASFEMHYQENPHISRQLGDIADLMLTGIKQRVKREEDRWEAGEMLSPDGKFMVRAKLYFAWQLEEEAAFLEDMSLKGWHFIEYTLGVYMFRKLESPRPYRFMFNRQILSSQNDVLAYLERKEREGWEFFKQWWGWYYFRQPLEIAR